MSYGKCILHIPYTQESDLTRCLFYKPEGLQAFAQPIRCLIRRTVKIFFSTGQISLGDPHAWLGFGILEGRG